VLLRRRKEIEQTRPVAVQRCQRERLQRHFQGRPFTVSLHLDPEAIPAHIVCSSSGDHPEPAILNQEAMVLAGLGRLARQKRKEQW